MAGGFIFSVSMVLFLWRKNFRPYYSEIKGYVFFKEKEMLGVLGSGSPAVHCSPRASGLPFPSGLDGGA